MYSDSIGLLEVGLIIRGLWQQGPYKNHMTAITCGGVGVSKGPLLVQ